MKDTGSAALAAFAGQPAQARPPAVTGPPLTVGTGVAVPADPATALDPACASDPVPEEAPAAGVAAWYEVVPHPAASTPAASSGTETAPARRPSRTIGVIALIMSVPRFYGHPLDGHLTAYGFTL
jgi:hypothetical protein